MDAPSTNSHPGRIVVGIAGASGIAYGTRFVEACVALGLEVHLLVSPSAWKVMQAEMGLEGVGPSSPLSEWLAVDPDLARERIRTYNIRDIAAPMASGTFRAKGMVVIPCSMKTVAAIAHGYTDNLLTRCADCFLKEGRELVLVPRETPLSLIHLENLAACARAGARIAPAMPGFYHNPATVDDLVDFMVMKVLDLLRIDHHLDRMAWKGMPRREASAP